MYARHHKTTVPKIWETLLFKHLEARLWLNWSTSTTILQFTSILSNDSVCQPTLYKLQVYHVDNRLILGHPAVLHHGTCLCAVHFHRCSLLSSGPIYRGKGPSETIEKRLCMMMNYVRFKHICTYFLLLFCHTESVIWMEWRGHWYAHPVFINIELLHDIVLDIVSSKYRVS